MHVWCALHTLQGVLNTQKSVHIETLLAHLIWCVVHIRFYSAVFIHGQQLGSIKAWD